MGACGLTPLLREPHARGLEEMRKSEKVSWPRDPHRDQVRDQLGYCGQQSVEPTSPRLIRYLTLGLTTPRWPQRGTATTPRSPPQGTPTLLDPTPTAKMSLLRFDQPQSPPKSSGTPLARADQASSAGSAVSASSFLTPRMRRVASILRGDQNKVDVSPQKRHSEEDHDEHKVEAHTPTVPLSALKGSRARHTSLSPPSPAGHESTSRRLDVGECIGSFTGSLHWAAPSTSPPRRKSVSFGVVEQVEFEMYLKKKARSSMLKALTDDLHHRIVHVPVLAGVELARFARALAKASTLSLGGSDAKASEYVEENLDDEKSSAQENLDAEIARLKKQLDSYSNWQKAIVDECHDQRLADVTP
eukprot:CAMPEP_0177496218 /NCGR_PEP_ID=MMETSP0369-20130122/34385_1 /TAXON_ID=447022 ORGANISM="Scrippsiella hangoei-like, Strain SHHI-4" /NCGR_SAMPLE_ID=MMETSP0369 /ASSEMBLY_ACC=CAM_ASM_000364 /LENGTH=358 /DNA_ID=CAMNT_0018973265 /DNA_START=68 /DNA_END=1145 /DNA_ORIENTATION=-